MASFTLIEEHPGYCRLDAMVGYYIGDCVADAIKYAELNQKEVVFNFNDVDIKVNKDSDAKEVIRTYNAGLENGSKKHYDSQSEKERIKNEQKKCDEFIKIFPSIVSDEKELMQWISDFSTIQDNINVSYDKNIILNGLNKNGYIKDDMFGKNDIISNNTHHMARFICGTVISQLNTHSYYHPIVSSFVDKYMKLHESNSLKM